MSEKTLSQQMAEFAVGLRYEDLPDEVVTEVKRYLYDSIGCALGGYHTRDVEIVRGLYRAMGGTEEATLIGFGDRMPAVNATLVNSLMVRALDYNDIYWKEDPSHPSDLIPAALAVGELVDAPMTEVIVAVALAYEFEMRLCEFAVPGIRERKWHHATLTQFVSPLVAGRLLGLGTEQIAHAIGINGSHNHTIGCPTAGSLTMMKNTVDPMAVQSGVFAALMARDGFTGTTGVLDGKEGFMDCFGDGWDVDKLVGGLGERFKILDCSMKAFPTEALTHTHISALLKVLTEHDIGYEEIESVKVTTIARACDILFDPHKYRPTTRETADHSLPWCLAVAMVDRKITPASFSPEKLADERIWGVIDRIEGEASVEFVAMFPATHPSRGVVRTTDGQEREAYLEYPKGDPREPMTRADLDIKFDALAEPLLVADRRADMRDLVFSCETRSARDFMTGLVV